MGSAREATAVTIGTSVAVPVDRRGSVLSRQQLALSIVPRYGSQSTLATINSCVSHSEGFRTRGMLSLPVKPSRAVRMPRGGSEVECLFMQRPMPATEAFTAATIAFEPAV